MSIQKILKYKSRTLTGKLLDFNNEIPLYISTNLGNYLIHKSILRHFVLKRQGTIATKTRRDVSGGGRKPWRQKGTGRARAGSNNSPLWKGGGIIFGPKPKNNSYKLNKKERRLALQTLLFNKKDNIFVIDNLEKDFIEPKTQEFYKLCHNCGINLKNKILIISSKKVNPLKLAVQNIKNVELISASTLNILSLIKAKQVILTPLAILELKEIFSE